MNIKMRVVLLLSVLLILSGCVFKEKSNENIVLQIAASEIVVDLDLKHSNYAQEYEEVEEVITGSRLPGIVYQQPEVYNGPAWLANKVQDATDAVIKQTIVHTYNQFGEKISSFPIPNSKEVTEATATIYEYGQPARVGAVWNPHQVTRYGYDCVGCSLRPEGYSSTSVGIYVGDNRIMQSDGSWKEGLTYNGYYLIAASREIPMCSIVKISNHPFSGAGIESGVPFYAIVADRGGGVRNGAIDLYAGSEGNPRISQPGRIRGTNTKVEIVGFGGCK